MTSVAIIGSKGIPACYGGFETLAENLVKNLADKHPITVYCSGRAYKTHRKRYLGAELKYLPLDANGVQSIPYDFLSMMSARRYVDVLLILGVSGCALLPLAKLFSKKKFIVHLDGIDWQRPKWGRFARIYLRFSERIAARYADCLIADNPAIQDYIFKTYKKDSLLIEYGGDNAAYTPEDKPDLGELNHSNDNIATVVPNESIDTGFHKYAFSVCRIEPENNIHIILEAFANTDRLPLVLVGNWSASEYGRSLRAKYGELQNILLLDSIYDQVKLYSLRRNATLYVHGHSAGGTNPSLVEAMYLGLPVLAFNVSFNKATTDNAAKYFSDVKSLLEKLETLDAAALERIADKMQRIGKLRYTWSVIAKKYSYLFVALDSSVEHPPPVRDISDSMMSTIRMETSEPAANPGYQNTLCLGQTNPASAGRTSVSS